MQACVCVCARVRQRARASVPACLSSLGIVARIYFNLKRSGLGKGRAEWRRGRGSSTPRSPPARGLGVGSPVRVGSLGWLEVWRQLGCEAGGGGSHGKGKLPVALCLLQQEGRREGEFPASRSLLSFRFGRAIKAPPLAAATSRLPRGKGRVGGGEKHTAEWRKAEGTRNAAAG